MAKVRSWAGLDVHASKVVACVVDSDSGEMTVRRLPGDTAAVAGFCAELPGPTRVAYEAGPTGFGLACQRSREFPSCDHGNSPPWLGWLRPARS